MKKYFLTLLGIFILMIIPNNVYAITAPTHSCLLTDQSNTCSNQIISQTWFNTYNVFVTTASHYSYSGSSDALPQYLSYYWQNANFCNNEGMTIEGDLVASNTGYLDLSLSLVMDVTFNNQTKRSTCAITRTNGLTYHFICGAVSGSGSVNLTFVFENYPIVNWVDLAINQATQISCNPNNASIINNATQNTQNIINSITGVVSSIGSIISDNQTNTQYLINTTTQTTQAVQSMDSTMQNDNIDSTYQNSTLDNLNSQLASNNVISDLLLLPVTLYQKILSTLGSNTCSSFSLGSLYGTELVLPCIQVQNYIGSALWTTIDLIFSGMFILVIRKKFVDIFNNMTNLKDGGNEIE